MLNDVIKKIKKAFTFKSSEMRIAESDVKEINKLTNKFRAYSDEELKNMTNVFRQRLSNGEKLSNLRIEAFAVAREATYRVLGKFPYDVQMIGGIILDLGSVAEMKTGEGKTITSIAPVYLNALEGKGVIVSTVNEYLSERDAIEMGEVHQWLGLTVGINKAQMEPYSKRLAYAQDITYSVHSEIGFDYLRDNMVNNPWEKTQRGLNFVLIDEVDSILIDEARTPLIISGGQSAPSSVYMAADQFVRTLKPEHFAIDEETKSIKLTYEGIDEANKFFNIANLYDIIHSELVHRIQNALRAHKIMKINVEYIVRDEKIELVDAFTGRIMEGRSYSEGLQQAIQAKEGVEIEPENQTLATITYQNLFRMFKKLSGMTGTAKTEEREFIDIYNMRVNQVPTNKPIQRVDDTDSIFFDLISKFNAIANEVQRVYETGQPILVGTSQVEESEYLHDLLTQRGIPHTVLNAKQNASEADIIANAGQVKSVTIATNMAGRGTDIKLSEEAINLGGLYVLGTDKAESRRIDNQLKGRSGRQGDIGYSKFFLSLDDQLITRFSSRDRWKEIFSDAGSEEIPDKSLKKIFDKAQKKIEGFNYDSRKSVLNYDDVIRQQRDLIYTQRDMILYNEDLKYIIERMIIKSIQNVINFDFLWKNKDEIDYDALAKYINEQWLVILEPVKVEDLIKYHDDQLATFISNHIIEKYMFFRDRIIEKTSLDNMTTQERHIILQAFDVKWQQHIDTMDKLRSSSNLVQYSQKNPYQIYTEKGSEKFNIMVDDIALLSMNGLLNNQALYGAQYDNHILSNGDYLPIHYLTPEADRLVLIENAEKNIAEYNRLMQEQMEAQRLQEQKELELQAQQTSTEETPNTPESSSNLDLMDQMEQENKFMDELLKDLVIPEDDSNEEEMQKYEQSLKAIEQLVQEKIQNLFESSTDTNNNLENSEQTQQNEVIHSNHDVNKEVKKSIKKTSKTKKESVDNSSSTVIKKEAANQLTKETKLPTKIARNKKAKEDQDLKSAKDVKTKKESINKNSQVNKKEVIDEKNA